MKWSLRVLGVLLLIAIALIASSRRANSGWIAYTTQMDGALAAFIMTGDGGSRREILPEWMCGSHPAWSPDGRALVIAARCGDDPALLRVRPGGAVVNRITPLIPASAPEFSADGAHLLVMIGGSRLHVAEPDGRSMRFLSTDFIEARWSPEGDSIVATRIFSSDLERIDPATGAGDPVFPGGADFIDPDWSADGSQMVVVRLGRLGSDLYRAEDGRLVPIPLDVPAGQRRHPRWSPDGTWIALTVGRGTDQHVYRLRPDGRDLQRLTARPGRIFDVQWSPDGASLLLEAQYDAARDIFLMDADGTSMQNLTPAPGDDLGARIAPVVGLAWRPLWLILMGVGILVASKIGRLRV